MKSTSCWRQFTDFLADYSDYSTVHGIRYIGERGRSCCEKIWWITVFCISVIFCVRLVLDAWKINPIIISFSETPLSIGQTPFPVVTICPFIFTQDERFNLTRLIKDFNAGDTYFYNISEQEKLQLGVVNILCRRRLIFIPVLNLTNCNECLDVLHEVLIPLDEIFVECKYNNRVFDCGKSFQLSLANHHLCYEFNGLEIYHNEGHEAPPSEWSIDEGYSPTATVDAYPRRVLGSGSQSGLSIVLQANKHDADNYCAGMPGFMLHYQMPYDAPTGTTAFFHLAMQESVTFLLRPEVLITSKELRHYTPAERNCYFSNEHQLKYLAQYTQRNCEIECEVEAVLEKCGCLPLSIKNPRGLEVCGPKQFPCYYNTKTQLFNRMYASCRCLPSCSSISFGSEISVAPMNMSALPRRYHVHQQDGNQYSQITIYMKDNQVLPNQRKELYGKLDFLANCGGLLGLFLGVSTISCVEVIYFFTIRLYCNSRKAKVHPQPEEDEDTEQTNRTVTKDLVSEYFTKTTIQGIAHVADATLSPVERTWWTLVVVSALFSCGYLVIGTVKRFEHSPIIVSYENRETRITEIPFPAVTLCPQIVYHDVRRMYDLYKYQGISLYRAEKLVMDMVTAVAQVCDPQLFGDIDPNNQTNCDNCSRYLKKMMDGFWNFIYRCTHMEAKVCHLFKEVVTEEGICFTYNGLEVYRDKPIDSVEEWSLDGGYRNDVIANLSSVYPRPGTRSVLGISLGILEKMIDSLCKTGIQGTKVYLHMPHEAPQISNDFFLLPFDKFVQVAIKPKMIVTDPELRYLPVTKRQCYFEDERYLRFFRNYTQINCEHECVANLTLSKCGCVLFFMPDIPGIKFCAISDLRCYKPILQVKLEQNMNESLTGCNCLKTCTSISYETEINRVGLAKYKDNFFTVNAKYARGRRLSRVVIRFKESQFIALRRSQIFGRTELLANCGGLLGLFMGFSLMSFFELLYFSSIRLVCNLKLHLRKN